MMKDMISDTQDHNIKVSTFTFRTKEESIRVKSFYILHPTTI